MDESSARKLRSDLLDQIKSRVKADPKFRDEFFLDPEQALKRSDLAPITGNLRNAAQDLKSFPCTWTCSWTGF